ncbi:MAG: peptidase [Chloroflexota bacterium]
MRRQSPTRYRALPRFALFTLSLVLAACQSAPLPVPTRTPVQTREALITVTTVPTPEAAFAATSQLLPASTPQPTATPPPTDTPSATATPQPTDTPTTTAAPDLLAALSIEALRARSYPGGPIAIVRTLEVTPAFTRAQIAYPSDGLRITGIMNIPSGAGPFPVIILNHGYVTPPSVSGTYLRDYADYYASWGYLTISPDYRGYGGSDEGDNAFRIGYAIDVLNLVSSVQTLPQADASRIGMWGHSMGGGISTYVMVIDPRVKAFVLYAAMSADAAENWRHIRTMWDRSGPDEWAQWIGGTPDELPEVYARLSPIHYLEYVRAPVSIHHGEADDQVPPAWSADLARRLQGVGAIVEYYSYPGAPHSFRGDDWRLFMERTLAFFDRYVKNGG